MPAWLNIVSNVVPVFVEWIKWAIETDDEEFESISKAWPAPIKTRLARIRYEVKRDKKFGENRT